MSGQPAANTPTSGSSENASTILNQMAMMNPVQIPGMGNGMGGASPLGSTNQQPAPTTDWAPSANIGHQQGATPSPVSPSNQGGK